jgi:hypothetical protein
MTRLGLSFPCPPSVQARCLPSGERDVSPTFCTLPRSARIARIFGFAGGCALGESAAKAVNGRVEKQSRAGKARQHGKLMRRMLTAFAARSPHAGRPYGSSTSKRKRCGGGKGPRKRPVRCQIALRCTPEGRFRAQFQRLLLTASATLVIVKRFPEARLEHAL